MSTLNNTPSSIEKDPKSIQEELLIYQSLAEKAAARGNRQLAHRWKVVADLVTDFIEYLHSSRNLCWINGLTDINTVSDQFIEAKEISSYASSLINALRNNDVASAKQFAADTEETKKVGICYRHWLVRIQQEVDSQQTINYFKLEEGPVQHRAEAQRDINRHFRHFHALMQQETTSHKTVHNLKLEEIAVQCRSEAERAIEVGQKAIGQHWAEAACLILEADQKKKFIKESYIISGAKILSSYYEQAYDAFYEAAQIKVGIARSLEQGDRVSAQKNSALAFLADKLACYRDHTIHAILQGEMPSVSHWKSAADFLSIVKLLYFYKFLKT
jgi:hypothetical protein